MLRIVEIMMGAEALRSIPDESVNVVLIAIIILIILLPYSRIEILKDRHISTTQNSGSTSIRETISHIFLNVFTVYSY